MYIKFFKRFFDIIFSLLLIILLSPVILISLIITILHLGFPIFDVRFPREGKNKKPFYMLKFRTRIYDTEDIWGRKTKLSTLIDNLKLNELPQLFNILIGDMSFVGPRPFICGENLPKGKISNKRYLVRPGVTGLFQVENKTTHKEKLKYDEIYYDNISLFLDLKILIKTPFSIVKKILKTKTKN